MDNTTYDIRDIADWMVKEGYFLIHKGKYLPTMKFNQEVRGVTEGITKLPNRKIAVKEVGRAAPGITPTEWRDTFMKFLADCKIPRYGRAGNGQMYELNKFSEKAFLRFRQMIEVEGIELERLQAITAEYYADNRTVKQNVSNYLLEGTWRTRYNTIEPSEGEYERFKLG
jgi:hypothetical protein